MPLEINGSPVTVLKSFKDGQQVERKQASVNQEDKTQPSATDTVSLTDVQTRVQELTSKLDQVPVVDAQRVEAVRNALADGSHVMDTARAADKLVRLERELGGR